MMTKIEKFALRGYTQQLRNISRHMHQLLRDTRDPDAIAEYHQALNDLEMLIARFDGMGA